MSELSRGTAEPSVTRPGQRQRFLWAGGIVFDVVLDGRQTGGAVALLDQAARRGDATPLHVHRDEAEIFYVLEGAITAWAAGESHELAAGAAAYLPANVPHAFRVDTESARIVTVTAPAGFADFVRRAGVPVDGDVPAQWDFDIGDILAAAPQHNIEILGPAPQPPG
jgi:quercetin dioxygenase-like cupin family protein